jgi:HEPN domain-containing protein
MSEFDKIKIGFALALLGVLFTLSPMITLHGDISYSLFGFPISIKMAFLVFALLLGSSVYFYAIALIGENTALQFARKTGHVTYASALLIPPLYLLLFIVSLIVDYVLVLLKSALASKILEISLAAAVGALVNTIVVLLFRAFTRKEKAEKAQRFTEQENATLSRAKQLYDQGYFDISVTESWKAIEISLKKAFLNQDIPIKGGNAYKMLQNASQKEIITQKQVEDLSFIRKLRNDAVHTDLKISGEDAQRALNIADKTIASLEKYSERCYYCGKYFPLSMIESDDITGASICKKCLKLHPNWKDELFDLGMET